MTTGEENMALLRRWIETYERDGFEAGLALVDEIFAADIEFSPMLAREVEGRSFQGRDGLREAFRGVSETLGEVRYSVDRLEAVGEEIVVVQAKMAGKAPGSGLPIDQDLVLVYEFEDDGLIHRATAYGSHPDALEAAKQAQGA